MKVKMVVQMVLMLCLSYAYAWVQFRNKFESTELYYICDTVERAEQVLVAADIMNKIAIIWTTFDSSIEPYFKLYLEYILELTKESDTVHIVLETNPRDSDFLPAVLQHVPQKSLFVMIHDSDFRFDLCLLSIAMKYLGKHPPVMFHMNHERPWIPDEHIGMKASMTHCITDDLAAIYPTYDHVFRNYFYVDFLNSSEYVPLLSLHPRVLQKYRHRIGLKPLSARSHWCRFAGRVNYNNMYEVTSPFHAERNEFLQLLLTDEEEHGNEPDHTGDGWDRKCSALFDVEGTDGHKLDYVDYIEYLADTVFAPCPAGNSPETFRHYEAMELGLVPIMVRPPPESDFLQAWQGYPGPIFRSWKEAMQYIREVDASTLDDLQRDIMAWYTKFKEDTYSNFSRKLNQIFHPSDGPKHLSNLAMDKTNGPTAAAQVLQYAPTAQPSVRQRKEKEKSETINRRLEALEDVASQIKSNQEELLVILRNVQGQLGGLRQFDVHP